MSPEGTRDEKMMTIARGEPVSVNLERRAADFTRHSPFKSPSGGSGWWWFKSTRVVEYQSPLLFPMRSDTIILCSRTPSPPLLLSSSSLIVVITATVAVLLLPPSFPDATMRDVFRVSWLRRYSLTSGLACLSTSCLSARFPAVCYCISYNSV